MALSTPVKEKETSRNAGALTSGGDCGTKMTESVVSSVLVRLWKKATSRKGPIPVQGAGGFLGLA